MGVQILGNSFWGSLGMAVPAVHWSDLVLLRTEWGRVKSRELGIRTILGAQTLFS